MRRLLFEAINALGSVMTHRQRRFLLDTLGLGKILQRFSRDDFIEFELPNGVRLSANPMFHGNLQKNGRLVYEQSVCDAIERLLKKGDVFYDVGANIGVFSFTAATLVGDHGYVHAFEPEENNIVCFRRTAKNASFENVVLHECAAGSKDGTMIFDRRGGAFSGRVVAAGDPAAGEPVVVQVLSIDSLVSAGARAPDLIKIDVEGGEGDVLDGMSQTLQEFFPVVLCEMHPDNEDGVSGAFAALASAGYICRDLEGNTEVPGPKETAQTYHILAQRA